VALVGVDLLRDQVLDLAGLLPTPFCASSICTMALAC
jgi:hypothetical protein